MNRLIIIKLGYTTGMVALLVVVTLTASTISLLMVRQTLFAGSQLIVLYVVVGVLLLLYAVLSFTVLQRRTVDGVQGFRHLYRAFRLYREAAELEGSYQELPTTFLRSDTSTVSTPPSRKPPEFDVFLSHNSADKTLVRHIADLLESRGLRVWLDERNIVPGRPWQITLEQTIQTAPASAIMIGRYGLGAWQRPEIWGCLCELVERRMPVVPVLLPGANQNPEIPLFLKVLSWVDLRNGVTEEGLDLLEWAITGSKPAPDRIDGRVPKAEGV